MLLMRLKPDRYTQLRSALLDAFNPDTFASLLRTGLGETLTDHASGRDPFPVIVEAWIAWAENGDRVPDLIAAAHAANPTNSRLKAIADAYDRSWLEPGVRPAPDARPAPGTRPAPDTRPTRGAAQYEQSGQHVHGPQVNTGRDTTIGQVGDVYNYYGGSDRGARTQPRPVNMDTALAKFAALPTADAAPLPDLVVALPPGSRMPLPHNPYFVGREAELRRLARALKGDAGAATMPAMVNVTSLLVS